MMATKVVSHREDEADIAFLRERNINPNEFAREAWALQMQQIRAEGVQEWFRRNPIHVHEPVEVTIRRMRDSR